MFEYLKKTTGYIGRVSCQKYNFLKITTATIFELLSIASDLANPFLLIDAIDELSQEEIDLQNVLLLTAGYGLTWTASKILPLLSEFCLVGVGTDLSSLITTDVVSQSFNLPFDSLASNTNAPPIQHFGAAYEHIGPKFIVNLYAKANPAIIEVLLTAGIFSYYYSYYGGGSVLIASGVYGILICINSAFIKQAQKKHTEHVFLGFENLIKTLDQYENAHYYGNAELEIKNFSNFLFQLDRKTISNSRVRLVANMLERILIGICMSTGVILGGLYTARSKLKSTDLMLIMLFGDILLKALEKGSLAIKEMYGAYVPFRNIAEYLLQPNALDFNLCDELNPSVYNGVIRALDIRFENVKFGYQDANEKRNVVLDGISFNVPAGVTMVITGLSGGGKSSIFKLIMGFHSPDEGKIFIGGKDVNFIKKENLRNAIAFVPQKPTIFNKSIYDNVKYGNLTATDGEVKRATEAAGLKDLVNERGQDKAVGEAGRKLSGGQQQRVSIARAFLRKESSILLLDEVTSALDAQTENEIIQNLNDLIDEKPTTTLMVTHKLQSLAKLRKEPHVIFLENGKIKEQGLYTHLINNKHSFFANQAALEISQSRKSKHIKRKKLKEEDIVEIKQAEYNNPIN